MNRNKLLTIGAVVLVIAFSLYEISAFMPRPIIGKPYTVDRLEYQTERNEAGQIVLNASQGYSGAENAFGIASVTYNWEDVTQQIDAEALAEVLSRVRHRRTTKIYFPYDSDDIVWQIDFIYKNQPVHILLGEFNVCYESVETGAYEILESELIKQALTEMVEK